MKKQITLAIAAALVLASCSDKQQAIDPVAQDGNSVSFATFLDEGTKGTPIEGKQMKENFGVYAYKHHGDNCMYQLKPDLMFNKEIIYHSSTKSFTYSPLVFWPEKTKVNFFAYAPYSATNLFKHPSHMNDDGWPELCYVVPEVVKNQKDLMFAEALNRGEDKPCVNLDFKHALTKVGVTAYLSDKCAEGMEVKITGLKFEKIKYEGEFNFENFGKQCHEWWVCNDKLTDYTVGLKSHNGVVISKVDKRYHGDWKKHIQVNADDEYLLVMPQVLSKSAKLCVDIEISGMGGQPTTITETFYLSECHDFGRWEPGQCIIYDLCIDLDIIGFEACITEWVCTTECLGEE